MLESSVCCNSRLKSTVILEALMPYCLHTQPANVLSSRGLLAGAEAFMSRCLHIQLAGEQ